MTPTRSTVVFYVPPDGKAPSNKSLYSLYLRYLRANKHLVFEYNLNEIRTFITYDQELNPNWVSDDSLGRAITAIRHECQDKEIAYEAEALRVLVKGPSMNIQTAGQNVKIAPTQANFIKKNDNDKKK